MLTRRAPSADLGEGVLLQRLHPGAGGPGGAPPRPVRLEGRGRRGTEGGGVRPPLLGQRVDAVGDGDTVGHGALAGLGEGDGARCSPMGYARQAHSVKAVLRIGPVIRHVVRIVPAVRCSVDECRVGGRSSPLRRSIAASNV